MSVRRVVLLIVLAFTAQTCFAQSATPLRVWAYKGLRPQLLQWEDGFTAEHPGARFINTFHGHAALMSGLYNGVADLVLMGRDIWPVETMAYRWVYQRQPFGVVVATADLDAPGQAFTPVVIVNAKNPIGSITLSQLDAVYGSEHRNAPANIRTWGELGLTGSWASQPIHVYGFGGEDVLGVYFRHDVLRMDFKPNIDSHLLTGTTRRSPAQAIAAAVATDPYAIGYTAAPFAVHSRILALAGTAEAITPTTSTLESHAYPMTRSVYLYFHRSNDAPLDARIDSFLRYILSTQGQALVRTGSGFLPLDDQWIGSQLHKLNAPVPAAVTATEE